MELVNKVSDISNFLAFLQFFVDKFTLLDPDMDPGGEMNADPDPQPWLCSTSTVQIENAQKMQAYDAYN